MELFHLGSNASGHAQWTDLPTIWVGSAGSGKSTQFVAPSGPMVARHGGKVIDPCWMLDPDTGATIENTPRLPTSAHQSATVSLIRTAFGDASSELGLLIDEPLFIPGFFEIWQKAIAEAIECKRPLGIALQTLDNCPDIAAASQHSVLVFLRRGYMLPPQKNMPFDVDTLHRFICTLRPDQVAISYPTGSHDRKWEALAVPDIPLKAAQ
ncbi:MAG: hypothetical protein ACFHHU_00420 [Porticoccaceae bacterium]